MIEFQSGKNLWKENMRNLIFTAVGQPLDFHVAYDRDNHWRYTKSERLYETMVSQYGEYEPDPETYDMHEVFTGPKWVIVKQFLDKYGDQIVKDYEYVGFFDDDLVSDIKNINRGFELAREHGFKLFQYSTLAGSASAHHILHQNQSLSYSRTNFIEGMSTTVHTSLIPTLRDFLDNYHQAVSGWGFDLILGSILREIPAVIHEASVYHPPNKSYYDQSEAIKEMHHILYNVYSKFMTDKYSTPISTDMDWSGKDMSPKVFESAPRVYTIEVKE